MAPLLLWMSFRLYNISEKSSFTSFGLQMIKLWPLEVERMRKSTQKCFQSLPSPLKCFLWPSSYSTLSKLSNKTKFVQIKVWTTRLWPLELKEKIERSSDVLVWQKANRSAD